MILWGVVGLLLVLLIVLLGAVLWRLRSARTSDARTRARLAALLENDRAGLAVWDAGGRLVACNGRFREFYPSVTLQPGLEFEDLVRYTATRAVVLVPEVEMDQWIEKQLERWGESATETLRTPDERWIEIRTRPTDQGETLLVYTDVTDMRDGTPRSAGKEAPGMVRTGTVRMLQEAMALGRDAMSFHQAAREVTRLLVEWGDWDAGTAYLAPADGSGALVSTGVWHVGDEQVAPLETRAALDACCDDASDHVLRHAVSSAQSLWIGNIGVDPRLSDTRRTALGAIRSICAAPVVLEGRVVAVLELFAGTAVAPDPVRERLIAVTVGQLGHVFERERAILTSAAARDADESAR